MRILHIFAVIVSIILESIGAVFLLNTPTLEWKESNIIALVAMTLTTLLLILRQKSEAEKALLERYYPIFRKINIVGSGLLIVFPGIPNNRIHLVIVYVAVLGLIRYLFIQYQLFQLGKS